MSLSFGGGSSSGKFQDSQKKAIHQLGANIDPSYGDWKHLSPGYQDAVAAGTEFGGYYQGAQGVGTFTSDGRYIPPGSTERLPTILPGYEALAQYDTLWGNYDQGALSPSQSAIMANASSILTGDTANSGGYFNQVLGSGLGAGAGGAGGGVPAPPDFANRTLNVDNIGALVGDIFDDMPEPFQKFTLDMLNSADESTVEASITDFTNKMMDFVNMSVEQGGRAAMDMYAAAGVGRSGTAVAGLVDIAVRSTIEASARVSEYALTRYDQAIKKMDIAESLLQDYLQAGANEQANRVQYEMSKLNAEAAAYGAYASAQATVQSALVSANARIQEQLIATAGQLEGQRMAYQNAQLSNMFEENAMANAQRTNALMLPYNTSQFLAGNAPANAGVPSQGSGISGVGELVGGIASLWTAASDVNYKTGIIPLGVKYRGYDLYEYNYIWSPVRHIGVMAQEVEKVKPEAVTRINGIKAVHYGLL